MVHLTICPWIDRRMAANAFSHLTYLWRMMFIYYYNYYYCYYRLSSSSVLSSPSNALLSLSISKSSSSSSSSSVSTSASSLSPKSTNSLSAVNKPKRTTTTKEPKYPTYWASYYVFKELMPHCHFIKILKDNILQKEIGFPAEVVIRFLEIGVKKKKKT